MESDRVYIEHCKGCAHHKWCTNHNEAKYLQYFNDCRMAILRASPYVQVHENELPPWLAKTFTTDEENRTFGTHYFPRTGAFEVHFNRTVIFSKLNTGLWPNTDLIGKKVREAIEIKRQPPPEMLKKTKTETHLATKKKRKTRKKRLKKLRSPSAKARRIKKSVTSPRYLYDIMNYDERLPSPPTRTTEIPRQLFEAEQSFSKFNQVAVPEDKIDPFEMRRNRQDSSGFIDNFEDPRVLSGQVASETSSSRSSSSRSGRKFKFPENSNQSESEFGRKSFPAKQEKDSGRKKDSSEEHSAEFSDDDFNRRLHSLDHFRDSSPSSKSSGSREAPYNKQLRRDVNSSEEEEYYDEEYVEEGTEESRSSDSSHK